MAQVRVCRGGLKEFRMKQLSHTVDAVFSLIRLGLWGGGEGSVTVPDAEEWDAAVTEAKRQGVQGIFCEGVRHLPKEQLPPEQTRIRLLLECDALERRSEHVGKTAEALLSRFRQDGLKPVIQKGPSIAMHYPEPLLRKSGDIDIFFRPDDFEKAGVTAAALVAPGKAETEPDGSLCYVFNDVTVEHHKHFFDSKAQFEGLGTDSPEAVILLQITHILKHSLGPGIGLKQICDYAVATRRILPECDIDKLGGYLREARLRRWLGRLDAFISTYLGVPQDELLSARTGTGLLSPTPLLGIVLQGGEFGHHNPFRRLMSSPRRRKLNTLRFFLQRLPFALSTAPTEWWHTFSSLVRGNITH